MSRLRFTNRAVADLSDIWNYTFDTWSEHRADTYYEMLIAFCKKIADNPELGKNYNGVADNLYGLRVGRHIIFYHVPSEDIVEIVRILHGSMDLKNRTRE
jgi:toxin ParE1/3/4